MSPALSWCLFLLVVGGPCLAVLIGSMIANAERHERPAARPETIDRQWTRADDEAAVARAYEQWTAGR